MKILQKLKFMLARKDTPTEARPDDMTSKKDARCCTDHACHSSVEQKSVAGCEHDGDCK